MQQYIGKLVRQFSVHLGENSSWKSLHNRRKLFNPYKFIPLLWNQKSFRSTCSEIIGETDLLLEDGMDIQELPVIVRKISETQINDSSKILKKLHLSEKLKERHITHDKEVKEMIEGLDKCFTSKGLFSLLELIPSEEVTPSVALQALKSILKLENSQDFTNKYKIHMDDEEPETLSKNIVIDELIDVICSSDNNTHILEALQLLSEELSTDSLYLLKQKLWDEILSRISDDKFNISEICSSASSFFESGNQDDIDKLWVGIMERQNDINEDNIMEVFRILLHVHLSRPLLLKILQKQLITVSLKLKGENISEILSILGDIKEFPYYIIQCLTNWLTINIFEIREEDLGSVIEGFMELPNFEEDIVKALEKFMIARKLKVKNPELVGSIMDYCNKYKIRSTEIFDSCSEYFVRNAKHITPFVMKSIFLPFGNLNFHPTNSTHFWKILEEELTDKFIQLYSEDALDIMLSFIFLEKFPIKFVKKIFNPYFLDKLHSLKDTQHIHAIRTKLKLLDTALTLECKLYKGPMLLPDLSSSLIKQDPRIQKMSDSLLERLPSILGPDKSLSSSVVLKNLPLTELYIIDIIVHPKGKSSLLHSSDSWNELTALLIHIPEHYDSSGQFLIGSQIMRKRHLRCIGLNVVDLNFNVINSLMTHKFELEEYLKNQLSTAEHAFSS